MKKKKDKLSFLVKNIRQKIRQKLHHRYTYLKEAQKAPEK